MYKKITIGAFALCLAAFFVFAFLMPTDEQASVKENRPLAKMPPLTLESLFSGEFALDFEEYLSDNVGLRSVFTSLGSRIEKLRGIVRPAQNQLVNLANGSQLALVDGKIMEIFKDAPDVRDSYISALNGVRDALGEDTSMYLLLAPTQIEFDTSSSYAELSDSQKDTVDAIYGALDGITGVNVYDRLAAHTDEYIYFRTDHHWTQRGAYYAYEALMEAMGEEAVPLGEMEYGSLDGFLGYLYNQANVPELAQYADRIEYFMPGENYRVEARIVEEDAIVDYEARVYFTPEVGGSVSYGVFMGGDHPFSKITTKVDNGKTALVIKDSYANALLPFLTSHYETVLVIDPRNYYGTVANIVSEYDVDDVIVVNYVFSSTFSSIVDAIEKITG